MHEHYKDVKETHKMLLAIEDQPQATRINPRQGNVVPDKDYVEASSSRIVVDCSHNDNPTYWCKQLQNKANLLKECRCRGLDHEELWRLPNKQIANVLISQDKTTVVIHKKLPVASSAPHASLLSRLFAVPTRPAETID